MKLLTVLLCYMAPVAVLGQQLPRPADTAAKNKTIILDSVVVNTGYQVLTKERATGAFTQVDNRTLNLQQGPGILQRLEAVTSAVAFNKKNNTAPAISVRGLSTINGPAEPLIILDNFPYEGDINDINPNMVESVTILKDATAASAWGARAGNGVIVINTKKGKYNQPLRIEAGSSLQVFARPRLDYWKTIAPADYIGLEQYLYGKGYYAGLLTNPAHPVVSPVVELLDRHGRGLLTTAEKDAALAVLAGQDLKQEFNRHVYTQHSSNRQYYLNMSGGSQLSAWGASAGLDQNSGALEELYRRFTARLENSFRPVKNLRVSAGLLFTQTDTRQGRQGYGSDFDLYPYTAFYDAGGQPLPVAKNHRMAYTDTLGGGRLQNWNYYPATDYRHTTTSSKANALLGTLLLQYQPGHGFTIEGRYQYETRNSREAAYRDGESYEARLYSNLYSQINYSTGAVTRIIPAGGILDRMNSNLRSQNWREQLNYTRSFGRHQLTALAGHEVREAGREGEAWRTWGYDPATLSGVVVDTKNNYPVITSGGQYPVPGLADFSGSLNRFVSFFANAAWTLDRKYQFTLSGRRDASNLFGVQTNNKWSPLWSAGGGWELSAENFYHWAALPFLKLRATWGYTGNADPGRSAITTLLSQGSSLNSGLPMARVQQYPNPNLRWEKTGQLNLGIDFSSKTKRISGTLDLYYKNGTGLLATAPVDITAGLNRSGVTKNVAAMRGQGIDLVLNSINTSGRLKWHSTLLLNYNTDKVTKAYLSGSGTGSYISDGNGITAWEGKPVHSIISYGWAGLDPANGNPLGWLDGLPSNNYTAITGNSYPLENLQYNGPALPQWFGAVTNSLEWKGLRLHVNVGYKFGYYFKRPGLSYGDLFGADPYSTADYTRRWQQPGDEAFTDVPSLQYPNPANRDFFYGRSSVLVEPGDHIRLQFINLSWQGATGRPGRQGSKQLEVFANAANLGILWRCNKRGLDPDYPVRGLLPPPSFALGIKLKPGN